jgi:hypothetical protein
MLQLLRNDYIVSVASFVQQLSRLECLQHLKCPFDWEPCRTEPLNYALDIFLSIFAQNVAYTLLIWRCIVTQWVTQHACTKQPQGSWSCRPPCLVTHDVWRHSNEALITRFVVGHGPTDHTRLRKLTKRSLPSSASILIIFHSNCSAKCSK